MSGCDLWAYDPAKCDREYCVGNCDMCRIAEEEEDNG